MKHKRELSRNNPNASREGTPITNAPPKILEKLVPIDELRDAETELEAVKSAAREVTSERNRLLEAVDQLTNDVRRLERENGQLAGKIDALAASAERSAEDNFPEQLQALERENGSLRGQLESTREQLGRATTSADKQVTDKLRKLEDKHTILLQQMETTRSQLMQVAAVTPAEPSSASADRFFWLAVIIVLLALGIVGAVALGWLG